LSGIYKSHDYKMGHFGKSNFFPARAWTQYGINCVNHSSISLARKRDATIGSFHASQHISH
jgi:hypothetical protein